MKLLFSRSSRFVLLAVALAGVSQVFGQTDPGAYPSTDREAARRWFNSNWAKTLPLPDVQSAIGFTGDLTKGIGGDVSQAWRDKVLLRLNIYRRMVGVKVAALTSTENRKAELATSLDAANGDIQTFPPMSWKFWTQEASDATGSTVVHVGNSLSNLSGVVFSAGGESPMIQAANRSLLMQPADALTLGVGDAGNFCGISFFYNPNAKRPAYEYSTWPSAGYVPHQLIPGRWSIMFSRSTDAHEMAVSVTRDDGKPVQVQITNRNQYGIVWTLDGSSEGATTANSWQGEAGIWNAYAPVADVHYHVQITGAKAETGGLLNGTGVIDYDVIGFEPSLIPPVANSDARVMNISTRSPVGVGDDVQIAGFVISGSSPKTVLIRAAGPALSALGVSGTLPDPKIELHDALNGNAVIATNDNWSSDAAEAGAIETAGARVGALAWTRGTKDAALLRTLPPGVYSVIVSGVGNTTGVAIIEVYDADESLSASSSRIVNISTRSQSKSGDGVQIAGFVIGGTQPRQVLIRAAGPDLALHGVSGVLPDPTLELHDALNGNVVIATNDQWSSDTAKGNAIESVGRTVGASTWTRGSRDAAILITLNPGIYSAVVKDATGLTGNAIVEVYEVP